jgi:hypothetical protein
MSALGQKQTSSVVRSTSALPPKVDMVQRHLDVCFVPKADISLVTLLDWLPCLPQRREVASVPVLWRRILGSKIMEARHASYTANPGRLLTSFARFAERFMR